MRSALFAAALAACFVVVWTGRAAPGVEWLDAGELTAAGFTMGVSHPPGQPGHALLARLAAYLPLGEVAFRSWMLLFGVLPVEYDDLTLVELVPGQHFAEVSRMLAVKEWRHRRSVTPEGSGCVLRDEIALTPRWRLLGPVQAWMFRLVFRRRHRVLRRLFGDAERQRADGA